jgi:flagellar protein FliO/FliZ
MGLQFLYVALFLVAIACLPFLVRKFVQGTALGRSMATDSRVVSVLAVGPQQKVVTVELGPAEDRIRLVLGVTSQQITCLHSSPVPVTPIPTTTLTDSAGVAPVDFTGPSSRG